MKRPTRAIILAAGLSTRLEDLAKLRPKPMLPICGTPLVRWAVLWLRSQGIHEIVINLHHLGQMIVDELGNGSDLGVSIVYSDEHDELLGTGGALQKARPLLDDGHNSPFVTVNGKLLIDLNVDEVFAHHQACKAQATMVLRPDNNADTWGRFGVDAQGNIVHFLTETRPGNNAGEPLMFTGVQILQPSFLDRIPATGPACVIRTASQSFFHEGQGLAGFITRDYWWEHSTVERYLQGMFNVLDGKARLMHAERPLQGIDPSAQIAPTAKIYEPVWIGRNVQISPNAQIGPYVQIGDHAVIEANVCLQRAIVWERVRVRESGTNVVLT